MAIEVWRQIPGHERYEASSLGRIRSNMRPNPCILNPLGRSGTPRWPNKFRMVKFRDTNCHMFWHRAIASAFHGRILPGQKVVFKDQNPRNCKPDNLVVMR